MTGPTTSVMLVVYNGAPYLAEAIESVLAQTYEPVEVVVVDDGSDDGSGEIARSYGDRVVCVSHDRRGIGASRNRALELASGQFFSFLDADDRLVPNAVERLVGKLEDRPELDMVFGHVREFVSPDVDAGLRARLRPPATDVAGRLPTTMVIRRTAFESVGGFATHLRRGVTLDWSARALERGLRYEIVDEVLFERRLHAENNGLREAESTNHYLHVVKAALDRRRAQGGEGSPPA